MSSEFDHLINVGIVIAILFVLLLLASILSLYQPITRFRIRKEYKANRQICEDEYEIIADSGGIGISILDWRSSIGWKRIDRVYEFGEGFLIVYNQVGYLTVPKGAFQGDLTINNFKNLASHMKNQVVLPLK